MSTCARTMAGALKASIHERGQCHVRGPDAKNWKLPGQPPKFLDVWSINPQANYEFPFGVIVPESELRGGEWARHRDKGTVWLPAAKGEGVEIAIFLIRSALDQSSALAAAGWHTTIVNASLPDGRRLLVVAGKSLAHEAGKEDIDGFRSRARPFIEAAETPFKNPRGILFASDKLGTRRFVEIAAECEPS